MIASTRGDSTITVVIPHGGRLDFILQAVLSVFQQTLVPEEVLVVNDANNADNLKSLEKTLEKFIFPGSNLLIVQSTFQAGAAGTRNFGFSKAKGSYVAFLDDDDIFLPWKLETQLKHMKIHQSLISHTNYIKFESKTGRTSEIDTSRHQGGLSAAKKLIFRECWIATPTVMIDKSKLVEGVRIFPEELRLGEDTYAWANALLSSQGILSHHDVACSLVRIHSKSIQRDLSEGEDKELRETARVALLELAKNYKLQSLPFEHLRRVAGQAITFAFNLLGKPRLLVRVYRKILIRL